MPESNFEHTDPEDYPHDSEQPEAHDADTIYGELAIPDTGSEQPFGIAPYDSVDDTTVLPYVIEADTETPFIVPPLDEMPAQEREEWLINAVLTNADNVPPESSFNARLDASDLLPPHNEQLDDLESEALALENDSIERVMALTKLSQQRFDGADSCWTTAFRDARQLGRIPSGGENPHALELIVTGQTDGLRLRDVAWAADMMTEDRWANPAIEGDNSTLPYVRARIKKAVIREAVASGDNREATRIFNTIPREDAVVHRDEAAVYLIEAVAALDTADRVELANDALQEITNPHLHTWAQIKIAKHDRRYMATVWPGIGHKLPEDWPKFTMRQRLGIIDDLTDSGDMNMAVYYTHKLADPKLGIADERRIQTDKTIEIAYRQSETEPNDGLRTIRAARMAAAIRLAELIAGGADEAGGTRALTSSLGARASQQLRDEYVDRLNTLTVHEIAARVHINPDTAIENMRTAAFTGTHAAVYEYRVMAAVSERLASIGRYTQAAEIAAEIPDSIDDNALKSRTFAAIARHARGLRPPQA